MADANTSKVTTKILSGARAVVFLGGERFGFFSNVAWSIRQEKNPEFVCGAYAPLEITSLSQEPVQISVSGFRTIGNDSNKLIQGTPDGGPLAIGMTPLSDLLGQEKEFVVKVQDRQTNSVIFGLAKAKVIDYSGTIAAKSASDFRLTIMGILWGDEGDDSFTDEEIQIDSGIV